ncbi:MAG: glycosyltransferase [Chloroflexi bacterium]|nr:glycosyltransferase [Chloroflexota bacterium]
MPGRAEPLKGVDTLLRAMALIQKRHPEVIEKTWRGHHRRRPMGRDAR